jgi:hypothetical protein
MNAARVIAEAQAAGITLAVRDGGLVLKGPKASVARFVEPLKAAKPAVIALLAGERTPTGVPAEWVAGVASLSIGNCPPSIPPDRWQMLMRAADRLLESPWGARLAALGWRAIDLFGADAFAPVERHDHKGLVWFLPGHRLIAATANTATVETPTGARQTYYRLNNRATEMVLLWELPASGQPQCPTFPTEGRGQ